MPSTRKTWIIAASLAALVIAALAWVFVLSPVREAANQSKDDAESVEASNEILSAKVARLRAQYAEIDTLRAQLQDFERHLPTSVDYESITREIERSLEDSEVTLLTVDYSEGIAPVTPYTALRQVTPAPTDPNAPVPDEADEGGPAAEAAEPQTVSGAEPTTTGALASVVPGFYQIPLAITVQGDYEAVLDFIESLQMKSERAILASSVSAVALRDTPEKDDAPEAEVGDLAFTVNAIAYVLEYDRTVLATDEEIPEKQMPPVGTDNVFAPERD